MPSSLIFDPPVVAAIYPSFSILSWAAPRYQNSQSFAEYTEWDYTVEFNCSFFERREPFSTTTTETYVVLAIPYPKVVYHVRLVARARMAGTATGYASAKLSFLAEATVALPWSAALRHCPCTMDSLLLAVNTAFPGADVVGSSRRGAAGGTCTTEFIGTRVLEGDIEVLLHAITYAPPPPPPLSTEAVLFVVVKCPTHMGRRTRFAYLAELMQEKGASVIFCGVERAGSLALQATHSFISHVMAASPLLASSIFCMTFGSSTCCLRRGRQLLLHSAALSGQLLQYQDGLLAESYGGFSGSSAPTAADLFSSADGAFLQNIPLGIQCLPSETRAAGLVPSLSALVSSTTSPLFLSTRGEPFDCIRHLKLLQLALFPSSPELFFQPRISRVTALVDGTTVELKLEGDHLQYSPRLTVLTSELDAIFPALQQVEPQHLCCIGSLVPWLQRSCLRHSKYGGAAVELRVLLQTDFGVAMAAEHLSVAIPADITELFRAAGATAPPWAAMTPLRLLKAALQLQPLVVVHEDGCYHIPATAATAGASSGEIWVPQGTAAILSALATAGEVICTASRGRSATNTPSGGLFGFMADVAFRLSTAANAGAASTAAENRGLSFTALRLPTRESKYLISAIREVRLTQNLQPDLWRRRWTTWLQRLLSNSPHLSEAQYMPTLRQALEIFEPQGCLLQGCMLAMEALLYTHVKLQLRRTQGSRITIQDDLLPALTMEKFVDCLSPIFATASSPVRRVGSGIEELVKLWTLCLSFELRRRMAQTFFCCIIGPAGCGASTVAAAVHALLQRAEMRCYTASPVRRQLVVRRLTPEKLTTLIEALSSGASLLTLVVGEASDVVKPGHRELYEAIRAASQSPHQQVLRLLTKADEGLAKVPQFSSFFEAQDAAAALSEASRSAGRCCCDDTELLSMSLSPSASRIAALAGCDFSMARKFAESLSTASGALLYSKLKDWILFQ